MWFFSLEVNIVSALHTQPSPNGIAKVYGYAWYTESSGKVGFIRRAKVELWEISYVETRLAISETDGNGYYEFNINMIGSRDIYVRIYCESYIIYVTDGVYGNTYWGRTPARTISEGTTTYMGIYYAPSEEVWWQAMDYVTDEFFWLESKANWVRSQVEIKYPKGSKPVSYGDVIELPEKQTYPWDRTTVLHEYAHCVMYALYGYFLQGSCSDQCQCPQDSHYFNSVSDSGFAFTEGFAEFMQCAVDDKPSNAYLSNLGDVDGDGYTNYFVTTIEDNAYTVVISGKTHRCKWYHGRCPYKPPCGGCPSFNNNGNTVEGVVAGIFWDIFDSANDDQVSMGFYPIWYVLSTYKPESMIEFIDRWPYACVDQQLCDVCLSHGIAVFDDLDYLFYDNAFFAAGDQAYCTDVLGSAKTSFGLAKGGVYENPEGRTERILTDTEHNTGNLIMVGGPAVSPVTDEFDNIFGITYNHVPGVSFEIHCEGESIYLNLGQYPHQDICIVYLGEHNSRNIMLVWGYGWEGTYAGSVLMGDPNAWQSFSSCHMLMVRWIDSNRDGLVQMNELYVECAK